MWLTDGEIACWLHRWRDNMLLTLTDGEMTCGLNSETIHDMTNRWGENWQEDNRFHKMVRQQIAYRC